jgi:ankyrin repeat protein
MNKKFFPLAGVSLLLLVLFIVWQDNHNMELELLKKDHESNQEQDDQDVQKLLSKLRSFEAENSHLKEQLIAQSKKLEQLQKSVVQTVEVTPKAFSNQESAVKVQVQMLENKTKELDDEKVSLSQQLKIAEEKLLKLENINSENVFRLSSALGDESKIEDPLLKALPTRSTVHDLVNHNAKEWLELGEFLKLSMSEKDGLGRTPVHLAAELGLGDQLDVLYKFGNKIDQKDNFGYTPLQRAVEAKSDALAWFYGKGVDYDVKDKRGWKLIHHAAKVGNIPAAKFLKKNGLNLHEQTPGAITPLMISLAYQQNEMALWLLKEGANINARDALGQAVLHYVARFSESEILRMLLKHHPTMNSPDKNGRTPLHYAALLGRDEMVKALLKFGAIAVFKDNGHCSPIHHAAMGHHIKVVETFLNYGVHVDELDVVGRTPLHLAVVLGNVKMVNLLLSWGANVSMQDGLGRTPKEWAEQLKRHHINKLFEDL